MKKILLLAFIICGLIVSSRSQDTLTLIGNVANNGGVPVSVTIGIDLNTLSARYHYITTDSMGNYQDTFIVSFNQGALIAWIINCHGDTSYNYTGYYRVPQMTRINLVLNFDYCPPSVPCKAAFAKTQAYNRNTQQPVPGVVQLIDLSTGSNLSYLWDFGDGTTATGLAPSHHYSGNGPYILCLTVSNANCSSTFCDTLSVDSNGNVKSTAGFTVMVGEYQEPTGLNAEDRNIDVVKVYPNPVTGELNLSIGTDLSSDYIIYDIFDFTGRKVQNGIKQVNSGSNALSIEVNSLASGTYILRIQNMESTSSVTFIKR